MDRIRNSYLQALADMAAEKLMDAQFEIMNIHELVWDADQLGHPIRVGLHTGEVHESRQELHGLAVTIASRVADQAKAGEILTTTVVQGIVEGGDFEFSDCGEADLKGIGVRRLVRLD